MKDKNLVLNAFILQLFLTFLVFLQIAIMIYTGIFGEEILRSVAIFILNIFILRNIWYSSIKSLLLIILILSYGFANNLLEGDIVYNDFLPLFPIFVFSLTIYNVSLKVKSQDKLKSQWLHPVLKAGIIVVAYIISHFVLIKLGQEELIKEKNLVNFNKINDKEKPYRILIDDFNEQEIEDDLYKLEDWIYWTSSDQKVLNEFNNKYMNILKEIHTQALNNEPSVTFEDMSILTNSLKMAMVNSFILSEEGKVQEAFELILEHLRFLEKSIKSYEWYVKIPFEYIEELLEFLRIKIINRHNITLEELKFLKGELLKISTNRPLISELIKSRHNESTSKIQSFYNKEFSDFKFWMNEDDRKYTRLINKMYWIIKLYRGDESLSINTARKFYSKIINLNIQNYDSENWKRISSEIDMVSYISMKKDIFLRYDDPMCAFFGEFIFYRFDFYCLYESLNREVAYNLTLSRISHLLKEDKSYADPYMNGPLNSFMTKDSVIYLSAGRDQKVNTEDDFIASGNEIVFKFNEYIDNNADNIKEIGRFINDLKKNEEKSSVRIDMAKLYKKGVLNQEENEKRAELFLKVLEMAKESK